MSIGGATLSESTSDLAGEDDAMAWAGLTYRPSNMGHETSGRVAGAPVVSEEADSVGFSPDAPQSETMVWGGRRLPRGDEYFRDLAASSPAELIYLLPTLSEAELSFAAEALGGAADRVTAERVLLGLIGHPSRVVREGVVYGLASIVAPPTLVQAVLQRVAREDESPGVRDAASEALGHCE